MDNMLNHRPEGLYPSRPLPLFNPRPIVSPVYSPIRPQITFFPVPAIVTYRKMWNGRKFITGQIRMPMIPLDKMLFYKDTFEVFMDRAMYNKMTILNRKSAILDLIESVIDDASSKASKTHKEE